MTWTISSSIYIYVPKKEFIYGAKRVVSEKHVIILLTEELNSTCIYIYLIFLLIDYFQNLTNGFMNLSLNFNLLSHNSYLYPCYLKLRNINNK